jgi:hypothetical protein
MMRFVVVGILMRLALSEQSYAAVGLLNTLGFNNDQFHPSGDCSMPNCRSFKSARRDSAPMSICTVQWAGLGSSSERKRASRLADSTSGACTHSSHKPPLAMPIARSKSGKSSFACSITATKDGDN